LSTQKPLRWGVVGLGWVASDFVAPGIVTSPGSELVACLGSTPEKTRAFADKFKVPHAHKDLASLVSDPDVDAVYIALPNAMHHAAVLETARAGKHILCEKPFAMKTAHAREMVEACRKAGVVLRIAHQIRLDAAVVRAREIVQSGRLGRLTEVSLERASAVGARVSWRQDFEQSGVMYDVGVHLLDLIHYVTGKRFIEVSAFTHPDRRDKKPHDTMTVLGRLEGDCHALAKATREVASAENNLLIEGDKATLVTSPLRFAKEHVITIRDANGSTEERFPVSPAYDLQVQAFETDVNGGRSLLPDGEDSLYTVAVTNAVLQAIDERRIVTVAP
jgi:1,5-anhydro-D-fructose reductase (1,5-anhydro-D-mannitol-forming)